MSSVTGRISEIKQPRGGYIKPSSMDVSFFDDGVSLHEDENIHASVVGMAVDYLTRFLNNCDDDPVKTLSNAFYISLFGAEMATNLGRKDALDVAKKLLSGIRGLDDNSVVNACKLVTFDVWFRNPIGAMFAKTEKETNPDKKTIENIQTMVKRSLSFFQEYGPIVLDGFTFEPNGYTETVDSGDGDFLTHDTIWDFKVSKSKPKSQHTLQLLMYWIMGQHSGQKVFKSISKIGIFNPRLNAVYLYDVSKVPLETMKEIEEQIICY